MKRRFTREERRRFRKRWRNAAQQASPEVRATLGIGRYPSPAEKLARRELVKVTNETR